jgi:hypothetical protein
MTKRIIWRKWRDPLAPLVRGRPFDGTEREEDEDNPDFHSAVATFDREGDYPQKAEKHNWSGPAIVGPIGAIPLHESNLPGSLFNFWVGDANFDLTARVRDTIATVPGVESLDLFSRYRFRIAIGRAFTTKEVLSAIDQAVNPAQAAQPAPPGKQEQNLRSVRLMLSSRFPYWAILVMPDGRHQCVGGDSLEEVQEKAVKFHAAKKTIFSWEQS